MKTRKLVGTAAMALIALAATLVIGGCEQLLQAAPPQATQSLATTAEPEGAQLAAATVASGEAAAPPAAPTRERGERGALLTVPELVKMIAPAVVHISTEQVAVDAQGRAIPQGGVGTGFIIDASGHVITNNHVVAGAKSVLVTLANGRAIEATLVGRDSQTDLAVLRIDGGGLTVVDLGNSADLEVGDQVVAIGQALDLPGGPTVTVGVVSALGRTLSDVDGQGTTLSALIQTDASINPGNSGGPLLNMTGRVVGINTAGIVGSENVGFAISIDSAKAIIAELVKNGQVERGYLGIGTATVTRSIARQNKLPVDRGVYLLQVGPGTPAERAGLRRGDIMVELGGTPVNDSGDLSRILALHKPGATVDVKLHRSGTSGVQSVKVTLGIRPPD